MHYISKGGHNVDVHQLTNPLKSSVHTRYLALVKDNNVLFPRDFTE